MHRLYLLVADAILALHALIVLFNVGALPLIWLGQFRRWKFVRNFCFRATHLLLIAFVVAETVLGAICPLTSWEDTLRAKAGTDPRYQGGYVAHWLHRLIFYDLAEGYFVAAYGLFFVLVLLTLVWVRPRRPEWWTRKG